MLFTLLLIPLFSFLAVLLLYRHTGKRQILRLDFVQFMYGMVIFPLMFVWLKSFIFFFLRQEIGVTVSVNDLFWADTVLSVVMLYIYGFVMIHSLTKSFNLRYFRDPLYDMLHHSEWFHLWISHLVIFIGGMVTASLLSAVNLLIPLSNLSLPIDRETIFSLMLLAGGMSGGFVTFGIYLSDPEQGNFLRIMKIVAAIGFLWHAILYFFFTPRFQFDYVLYWMVAVVFVVLTLTIFFFERSKRSKKILSWWKHHGWEDWKLFVFEKK